MRITRHTSHATRHTSHVTRHTSHVIRAGTALGSWRHGEKIPWDNDWHVLLLLLLLTLLARCSRCLQGCICHCAAWYKQEVHPPLHFLCYHPIQSDIPFASAPFHPPLAASSIKCARSPATSTCAWMSPTTSGSHFISSRINCNILCMWAQRLLYTQHQQIILWLSNMSQSSPLPSSSSSSSSSKSSSAPPPPLEPEIIGVDIDVIDEEMLYDTEYVTPLFHCLFVTVSAGTTRACSSSTAGSPPPPLPPPPPVSLSSLFMCNRNVLPSRLIHIRFHPMQRVAHP